jgi:hypothetical protein
MENASFGRFIYTMGSPEKAPPDPLSARPSPARINQGRHNTIFGDIRPNEKPISRVSRRDFPRPIPKNYVPRNLSAITLWEGEQDINRKNKKEMETDSIRFLLIPSSAARYDQTPEQSAAHPLRIPSPAADPSAFAPIAGESRSAFLI